MQIPWELWKCCIWHDMSPEIAWITKVWSWVIPMKLFWLIPHFTGVERNQDKEKFNNLFKARQISKQVLRPLDSQSNFLSTMPVFPFLLHLRGSDFYSEEFPLIIKIVDWDLIQGLPYRLFCIYLTNFLPLKSQNLKLFVKFIIDCLQNVLVYN